MEALPNCQTYELKEKDLTTSDIVGIPVNTTHLHLEECTITKDFRFGAFILNSNYSKLADAITNLPNLRQLTVRNCPKPNILISFSKSQSLEILEIGTLPV